MSSIYYQRRKGMGTKLWITLEFGKVRFEGITLWLLIVCDVVHQFKLWWVECGYIKVQLRVFFKHGSTQKVDLGNIIMCILNG